MSHALKRSALALYVLFAAALAGCTVQFAADYDAATFDEILRVGKKVDLFYGSLLDTPPQGRAYTEFGPKYVEIESDLRSLWVRNQARALNAESTEIVKKTLDLWAKYKAAHKQSNAYSDVKANLHRDRFVRLFLAAADAEAAKRLGPEAPDEDQ